MSSLRVCKFRFTRSVLSTFSEKFNSNRVKIFRMNDRPRPRKYEKIVERDLFT